MSTATQRSFQGIAALLAALAVVCGCNPVGDDSPAADGDTDRNAAELVAETPDDDAIPDSAEVLPERDAAAGEEDADVLTDPEPQADAEEADLVETSDTADHRDPDPEYDCDYGPASETVDEIREVSGEADFETYSLLDRVTIVPCEGVEVDTDSVAFTWAVSVHRSVEGTLYFGNSFGLWRLDESTDPQQLVCVPGISETAWSMASRMEDGVEELWVGLDGRVGVLRGWYWEFIDIPGAWRHEGAHFNGPESGAVWKVAVNDRYQVIQTTQGIAYRENAGEFSIIDWCCGEPFRLPDASMAGEYWQQCNKAVTSSTWAGLVLEDATLYVGGKQALFTLDFAGETCDLNCVADDPESYFVAYRHGEDGLHAVRMKPNLAATCQSFNSFREPYTSDVQSGYCGSGSWVASSSYNQTYASSVSSEAYHVTSIFNYKYPINLTLKPMGWGSLPDPGHLIFHTLVIAKCVGYSLVYLHVPVYSNGWISEMSDYGLTYPTVIYNDDTEWSSGMELDEDGLWYSPRFTRIELP